MDTIKAQAAEVMNSVLSNFQSNAKSPSSQTILITGASGFVATHTLNVFLEAGYSVRGTVRSDGCAAKVRETHAMYSDRLSFAIVPDIRMKGALDEAVKGVEGVR